MTNILITCFKMYFTDRSDKHNFHTLKTENGSQHMSGICIDFTSRLINEPQLFAVVVPWPVRWLFPPFVSCSTRGLYFFPAGVRCQTKPHSNNMVNHHKWSRLYFLLRYYFPSYWFTLITSPFFMNRCQVAITYSSPRGCKQK